MQYLSMMLSFARVRSRSATFEQQNLISPLANVREVTAFQWCCPLLNVDLGQPPLNNRIVPGAQEKTSTNLCPKVGLASSKDSLRWPSQQTDGCYTQIVNLSQLRSKLVHTGHRKLLSHSDHGIYRQHQPLIKKRSSMPNALKIFQALPSFINIAHRGGRA